MTHKYYTDLCILCMSTLCNFQIGVNISASSNIYHFFGKFFSFFEIHSTLSLFMALYTWTYFSYLTITITITITDAQTLPILDFSQVFTESWKQRILWWTVSLLGCLPFPKIL
jgi:hypothetical protein